MEKATEKGPQTQQGKKRGVLKLWGSRVGATILGTVLLPYPTKTKLKEEGNASKGVFKIIETRLFPLFLAYTSQMDWLHGCDLENKPEMAEGLDWAY